MPTPPLLPDHHRRESLTEAIRSHLGLLFALVSIPWAIEILDFLLPGSSDGFGIRPRTLGGIVGIGTMSFLHGGFGHLASNTVPFLLLGGIVLIGGRHLFLTVSALVIALGGAALWMLGPSGTNHIGASLLIFGYLGFVLARGWVERSLAWSAVGLAVLLFYGGMLFGVLPGQPGISWQGHLLGFLAGVLAARILFTRRAAP